MLLLSYFGQVIAEFTSFLVASVIRWLVERAIEPGSLGWLLATEFPWVNYNFISVSLFLSTLMTVKFMCELNKIVYVQRLRNWHIRYTLGCMIGKYAFPFILKIKMEK